MVKSSELYQHALSELRLKGLLGSGSPLPNTSVAVALSVVEVFDDFKTKTRSLPACEACVALIRELIVRLPLRQVVPDINDFGLDLAMRLVSQLPLSPLKGDDAEWTTRGGLVRNRRCPRVQKRDGQAYDTLDIKLPLTFPYYPPIARP